MPLTIEPMPDKVFGAVVTGVTLADIDNTTFKTLYQAFLEYGFLLFRSSFCRNNKTLSSVSALAN